MLAIRCLRSGRTNTAFFRIVLTENSRPPKSGFIKILGWYNPHTKETSLNKEEIIGWLNQGAQASNTVARLLELNGVKHKQAKFIKDAPKEKKSKGEPKPKSPAPQNEVKDEAPKESALDEASETTKIKEKTEDSGKQSEEDEKKIEDTAPQEPEDQDKETIEEK